MSLGRLDEAKATAQEAQAHNLDLPAAHLVLYLVGFLQHDLAAMERESGALKGKPGLEDAIFATESETSSYGGEFAKARELTRRAVDSAQRADEKEAAAEYMAEAAAREVLVGNMARAVQGTELALGLASGEYVEVFSAIALGMAGDSARAEHLAADLNKRFPEDTIVQSEYLPTIRAAIALRGNDPRKAIEELTLAVPYESGQFQNLTGFALGPAYLRGEAYLAARQGASAEVEFQKILDHPGVVANQPIGSLAHLGLGRAFALTGDTAKAKAAYQGFFTLWKNADPDIPILIQANAEYVRLTKTQVRAGR
jgi:hypothetical protein